MTEKIESRATELQQEEYMTQVTSEEMKKEREFLEEKVDKSPLHGLWALTNRDLKKWYKAPIQLFISLIQPILWLGIFGKALNFGAILTGGSFSIPGVNLPPQLLSNLSQQVTLNTFGTTDYFSFLAIGMLSFVMLFTAMFSGMSIVWDRRFGSMNKFLSTPVGRGAIVMSKVFNSVIRSLIQAAIVMGIAVVLGMNLSHFTLFGVLGTFTGLFLMTLGLSSLFVMLALRSSDWQTQMAIMNLINLPLLFASNALFPTSLMPTWLQYFVKVNPISYATDLGRQLMLGATGLNSVGFDFAYLTGFALLFSSVGIIMSWRLLTK